MQEEHAGFRACQHVIQMSIFFSKWHIWRIAPPYSTASLQWCAWHQTIKFKYYMCTRPTTCTRITIHQHQNKVLQHEVIMITRHMLVYSPQSRPQGRSLIARAGLGLGREVYFYHPTCVAVILENKPGQINSTQVSYRHFAYLESIIFNM